MAESMPELAAATPTPDVDQAPEGAAEPPTDTSSWYRNRGPVTLIVQPDRYPSARLEPGQATWLPRDPQHPDLDPCDAPEPDAVDDTARSEK